MRLIEEEKLMEDIQKTITEKSSTIDWMNLIHRQPVAYDIDNVVEQLEELADESYKAYCIAFNSDDRAEYDAYTNAIGIVKHGGVSDDVCEWKSVSKGEFIQNPHTKRLYSNEPSMRNVYCNTCGKKIKIVGD